MKSQSVKLGTTKEGKNIRISPKERATHMQIVGASGKGKSKFMEHLIREDIITNNGLCLIDPHGYLYRDLLRWAETKGMLDRGRLNKKIILFDPSDPDWTFGFNPLAFNSQDLSYYVDTMVKAVAKAWGAEDTDRTPLLDRCLTLLFSALAEKNLTLLEANHLLNSTDGLVREYLTMDLKDPGVRQDWAYMNSLKPRQFMDEFSSTINRMNRFLKTPAIRAIIGQAERTINFRKIMDEGYILLCNLGTAGAHGNKITDENARLLGTLIVNDLLMRARERSEGSRPFYLYIDECGLFVNKDIDRICNECRKFGLHLILAHQNLAQLKKAGESVYQGVMGGTQTKVVFGGLPVEEADVLANQVFLGELDLEEAKESLITPVVTGHTRIWLENHSKTQNWGEGWSESSGKGEGESTVQMDGQSWRAGDQLTTSSGASAGKSSSWSESKGFFNSYAESTTQGRSEALMPVLEDRPSAVFSLPDQVHKAMAVLVNQKTQHAIIKLPDKHTEIVMTPTIKDGNAREARVERFKTKSYRSADYVHPRAGIEEEIQERERLLVEAAKEAAHPAEPKDFKEKPPAKPKVKAKKPQKTVVKDNFWEEDE